MVFWQLTVDANDPATLARFWARALGYRAAPPDQPDTTWHRHYRDRLDGAAAFPDRLFDPEGRRPPLWFQRVPEGKRVEPRTALGFPARQRTSLIYRALRIRRGGEGAGNERAER